MAQRVRGYLAHKISKNVVGELLKDEGGEEK
jgi:hypothetical protein